MCLLPSSRLEIRLHRVVRHYGDVDLPVFDARGGSLASLVILDGAGLHSADGGFPLARSLVVVVSKDRVLMGFNVRRRQWELPGGALEPGESPHDAAVRELAEETGIRADELNLVARAEFVFGSESTRHWAAVFNAGFGAPPATGPNDEMDDFRWWNVGADLWEGLSPIDAEVARRCLPNPLAPE